ncbi:MAG: heavy metal-binding domain-containing protein [Clostridia bacterium]|nr:heavy metal-binding domain-containing protein [Clostridia bacterium]
MLITTVDKIEGKKTKEVVGYVKGSTVRAKHIGKDIMAGLKTIVGGEITEYTEMMDESRKIAIGRMVEDAKSKGCNAIVGMRFASSAVMQGASEFVAYGTGVILED